MGNISSNGGSHRRRHGSSRRSGHHPPPPPVTPQPEITTHQPFVYPGASPYPNPPMHYPQYHYPGYYPPMHHHPHPHIDPSRYYPNPCGPVMNQPAPFVEHQKAVTIRNDVNIKKETLSVSPDEQNPGFFLVSFTFDATVSGRILEQE
ncbi:hypothetical protein TSUD_337650 [Trifolium subterraneum]|uniref:RING-type E3 ubiquitin transferase n=1 Tax=Trifolium subterraneum TaxID=3900 RepID=A0A2Z6LUA8_TRISU|nr:hypothetical protein TSUD_337650 [Trifolium subterraneum]